MNNPIITCRDLGKKYIIGNQEPYYSLRDNISRILWKQRGHINSDFWALKNINLDISQGDTIGIIGRNGAGKSTLLKILSRITPPTTGSVVMRGRVVSLLEVGTGFHQELTGRENIYLNGAILGMRRKEVKEKFNDIVEFSEIGKFLDTPVKRYSSGMFVRLAFSVAAYLESEILLVDEILSVGDISFQKKCLGRIGEESKNGRTVVLVSHNMGSIVSLCKTAIWINDGQIKKTGNSALITKEFISNTIQNKSTNLNNHPNRDNRIKKSLLTYFSIQGNNKPIEFGSKLEMIIGYNLPITIANPEFSIIINSIEGFRITTLTNTRQPSLLPYVLKGKGKVKCIIGNLNLLPGEYNVSLRLWQVSQKLDDIENVTSFRVISSDPKKLDPSVWNSDLGVTYADANWETII